MSIPDRFGNTPRDYIRALVCHYPSRIRKTRLLVMLRAYIDDSRHDREAEIASGVYVLAGYVGYVPQWEEFSDEWDKALRAGPRPLDYLKTFQAYRLDDPKSMFFGWSSKERDEKLISLAQTVNRFAFCSVQTGVRPEEYDNTLRWIVGVRVYHFLFYSVIAELAKMLEKQNINDKIEIYFDEQGDESKKLLRAGFEFFMDRAPGRLKERISGEPEFKSDLDIRPLQAADLMAWHIRRNVYERDRGRNFDTPVFDELLNLRRLTGLWDQRKLKTMLHRKLQQIEPRSVITLPDPSSGWGYPYEDG